MRPSTTPRTPACSAAMLAAMLLMSALVTALAAYLALEWLPCSWFGSGFEGACGYGAVWTVAAAAFLLWPVLFLGAAAVYFRRGQGTADTPPQAAPSLRLLRQWQIVLGLTLLAQALPLLLLFTRIDVSPAAVAALWWLGVLMLVVNGAMVYRLAARMQRQPLLLALIAVVFGWLGAAGVGIYLHSELRRAPLSG